MRINKSEIYDFVFKELQFNKYWLDGYNYIQSTDQTILNIWKVSEDEKEVHADRIHNYLKKHYFQGRDLSALKLSILELYYNIFDHAKAKGNAFSFIRYNQETKVLKFAVCDFGRGIAQSIREKFKVASDSVAICKAIEDGVTIGSQEHNAGHGLTNIVGVLFDTNNLKIISNRGLVNICGRNKQEYSAFENDFNFRGTLVYFDVSMDQFEIEETTSFYEF